MKTYLCCFFILLSAFCNAQPGVNAQWTLVSGDTVRHMQPVYGTKGFESAANIPGARYNYMSWKDKAGNFWLFGGEGSSANGSGYLNDLWKFNPVSKQWAWISGNDTITRKSKYGIKGVPSPVSMPGGRYQSSSWIDTSGNLWLYGGSGYTNGNSYGDLLDELWKYDIANNQWTWVGGDTVLIVTAPYYGMLGVAGSMNNPGSRQLASAWTDTSNNLWLYSGAGYANNIGYGGFNDLWKYNVGANNWTWVKGDSTLNSTATYGTKGMENTNNHPAGSGVATWTDDHHNFWMFGGGNSTNDLWRYNLSTNNWTWVSGDSIQHNPGYYGIKGTSSALNQPSGRGFCAWWNDEAGNFWLFGGVGIKDDNGNSFIFLQNDLWKYNTSMNEWTWMKGDSLPNVHGVYGVQGIPGSPNSPGARKTVSGWTDNAGRLWLFGGAGYESKNTSYLNDLWQYNPATNNWTWEKGDTISQQYTAYGTKGIETVGNNPGVRAASTTWKDNAGVFWMYGGSGYDAYNRQGLMRDMWRLNPVTARWTWTQGDSLLPADEYEYTSNHGIAGVENPANTPGSRGGCYNWVDAVGGLWMFGGSSPLPRTSRVMNDLWRYNSATANWAWMKGDTTSLGNTPDFDFGTKGVPSPSNKPGGLTSGSSWKDNAGNFWLFGGLHLSAPCCFEIYNTLWKYEIGTGTWIWINGSNTPNNSGQYGTQGVPAIGNTPGSRDATISWTDNTGNFWLFGGEGFDANGNKGYLNDLWKYDVSTNQWTWMKGDNLINRPAVYGTKGIADPGNKPDAISESIHWMDNYGNFWLYGGYRNLAGIGNDLWKYNIATNQWTWVKGSTAVGIPPVYTGPNAAPGSKYLSPSWEDNAGNFWLYSGGQYDNTPINDLWKINSGALLPLSLLKLSATYVQKNIEVEWQTSREVNVQHFVIERSKDGRSFSAIGSVPFSGNNITGNYTFTDREPFSNFNFYRLKIIDVDGSFSYSDIVSVNIENSFTFQLFPNPARELLHVRLSGLNERVILQILNETTGSEAKAYKMELTGSNVLNINIKDLPAGNYSLRLIRKMKSEIRRFEKL